MDYPNVDPFIGCIIANGKATLKELKADYSLEDAFNMFEIIVTSNFNQWLAHKEASRK